MRGYEAVDKLVKDHRLMSVLDIGVGAGEHSKFFLSKGAWVTGVDIGKSAHFTSARDLPHDNPRFKLVLGDFNDVVFLEKFGCVWACHVLEHQPNPVAFLQKVRDVLHEDGVLAVTVPPMHSEMFGGHMNIYTPGILLYQLVMAGFDCSQASVKTYPHNISVIVQKKTIEKYPVLHMDTGDIDRLKNFFPRVCNTEASCGLIERYNWE